MTKIVPTIGRGQAAKAEALEAKLAAILAANPGFLVSPFRAARHSDRPQPVSAPAGKERGWRYGFTRHNGNRERERRQRQILRGQLSAENGLEGA